MKRRILSVLLSLVMLIGLLPTAAMATETTTYPVKIGETGYESLALAIDAAKDGDTIKLLADIAASGTIEFSGGIKYTLDLAGKTLTIHTASGDGMLVSDSSTLTVVSSTEAAGTIKFSSDKNGSDAIQVDNNSTLNLEKNVTLSGSPMSNNLICANTKDGAGRSVINLNGANIVSTGETNHQHAPIVLERNSTFNMNSGSITIDAKNTSANEIVVGAVILSAYGSRANLNGGTITVDGNNAKLTGIILSYYNGKTDGYAVLDGTEFSINSKNNGEGYVFLNDMAGTHVALKVNKGCFTGNLKEFDTYIGFEGTGWNYTRECEVEVFGGRFPIPVPEEYCADGFIPTFSTDGDCGPGYGVEKVYYTIAFDPNGGEGIMAALPMARDTAKNLTKNTFTKEGMNFAGWATSEGGAVVYADETQVSNLTAENEATVTLYAIWDAKPAYQPTTPMTTQTKPYNGAAQGFTMDAGYTVTYKQDGNAVTPKNVGSYDVVITKAEDKDHAAFNTTITGGLVIEKATLTVKADNKSINVNDALPTYTYTVTGWKGADVDSASTLLTGVEVKCEGASNATANSYTITVTGPESIDNYTITYQTGTLTVSQRSGGTSGRPGGSSSSGGTKYPVIVEETEDGEAESSRNWAERGDTVTITVKPDEGYELDELIVTDKDGDELKLTKKNGKYTFTMPGSKVTIEATFAETEEEVKTFIDVPETHTFYDAVSFAAKEGIIEGYANGTFGVANPATVNAAVVVVARTMGQEFYGATSVAKATAWAAEMELTTDLDLSGYVTREVYMILLWRAAGMPMADQSVLNQFSDAGELSEIGRLAMAWAVENGLIEGYSDGTVRPDGQITRGAMAAIAMRYLLLG